MRDYKNIIKEAELLASSPEAVVTYLKERSSQDGDDALEQALLGLNHPLIDLALAQYGRSIDVLKSLFHRGQLALRVAVLANQAVARWAYNWPVDLFENATGREDKDLIKAYLADASDEELCALFQNPKLNDRFLYDFLGGNELWIALSEEKKTLIVGLALCRNERMRARDDFNDDYLYNPVFHAAWELAKTVPVTRQWAGALNNLYIDGKLIPISSMKNPLEVATRWQSQNQDNGLSDSLCSYLWVRTGLARLALANGETDINTLLESEDLAFRAAAYSYADLTSEQITQAYERDGEFAFDALVKNKYLWKHDETRKALQKALHNIFSYENPFPRREFNAFWETFEKEHPEWFQTEEGKLKDPVTKEDFEKLTDRTILPNFQYLSSKINILENNLKYIFWFSFAVLLIAIDQYF